MVGPDAHQEGKVGKEFYSWVYSGQSSLGRAQCPVRDHPGKFQGQSQEEKERELWARAVIVISLGRNRSHEKQTWGGLFECAHQEPRGWPSLSGTWPWGDEER